MNTSTKQETFLSTLLWIIPVTAWVMLFLIFSLSMPKPISMNDNELVTEQETVAEQSLAMKNQ